MSNILKRQVKENVFNHSGCMFFIEASKKLQRLCCENEIHFTFRAILAKKEFRKFGR